MSYLFMRKYTIGENNEIQYMRNSIKNKSKMCARTAHSLRNITQRVENKTKPKSDKETDTHSSIDRING